MTAHEIFNNALKTAKEGGFSTTNAKLVSVFTDGLSHHTALFAADEQAFVVKVFRHNPQLAQRAIRAQWIAAQCGLAPAVLYSCETAGILLCAFLDTPAMSQLIIKRAARASQLERIAKALATLHRQTPTPDIDSLGHFNIVQFCDGYVHNLGAKVQQQHAALLPTLHAFQARVPHVLCHNDLVAANIFCSAGGPAQFIDWEYAQLNNPWFDLAAVVFYLQLSGRATDLFLNHYRLACGGKLAAHNNAPLSAKACLVEATTALLWGDVLWHLHTLGNTVRPQLAHKFAWLEQHALVSAS